MNVRFFGGRKEEYASIPKHNPIGLYFCADTRELFLGDRLLSDGLRVVPTFADLPNIREHKAAEGIVYFVAETKNGYVLPRGGSEWLQVIYAPTTGEGAEIDLSGYYTKAEVDEAILEAIANVKIEVDLTGYALKSDIPSLEGYATEKYVDDAIAAQVPVKDLAKKEEVEEVKTKLETEVLPTIQETILPTVQELAEKAATQDWVKKQGYLTEHQSLEGLATEEFVNQKIAEAELADKEVDLSIYYTKSEVDALIPEVPSKVSELENDAGYITAKDIPETDLSNYYNKTETENLIAEAVENITHPDADLSDYATEKWVNEQGFLKEHQDLSEYAKKSDIPEAELFIVDFNTPNYNAAVEAYNKGKLLLLTNAAPDVNSYAIMNYVSNNYISFTKFLMSRSGTYGSFNTYYLRTDNTWELAKEVKLNKVEAIINNADKINGITIGKETYTFDYATTETVNQINQSIQNIENTYVTNETLEQKNYVTEHYVTNNYITAQQVANTYVTTEQVTEVVTNEVSTVVTEQIETKVTEVIEKKIEDGNLEVKADTISYDTW